MSVKDLSGYKELAKKQKVANKYLKQAQQNFGENYRFVNSAINRINMFQKKRGKKLTTRLTMSKLTEADIEDYNTLLDSILESTYLNPEKYKAHKEKQLKFAIDEGWAKNEEEAENIYRFANSELVAELKDRGLGDIPSKLVEKYSKYVQGEMTEEDFIDMASMYMEKYSEGTMKANEFFDYADAYNEYYKEFKKIQELEHQNGLDTQNTFADMYEIGIYSNPDIKKAMSEYISEIPMEDGYPVSFLSYFFEYYG